MTTARFDLASDNTAGVSPAARQSAEDANKEFDASYGDDKWTGMLRDSIRELFETDCEVFVVFNGTAANALALAQLCRPYHGIICHRNAHIETDECGAPEFFSGGAKLLTVPGANGKLELDAIAEVLRKHADLHSSKPRVISVTQSTELGTVYTRDELSALAKLARERSLYLHMDGARFANAVASSGCAPREMTWEMELDVLCFGGTKNGAGAGDLVVFFKKELAQEFEYRVKQSGQLASKTRFLSAPWVGLLREGAWLKNAQQANASAAYLASRLRTVAGLEPVFPLEANAVFVRFSDHVVERLRGSGWRFYNFIEQDIYRLMCSWATTREAIDLFIRDVESAVRRE